MSKPLIGIVLGAIFGAFDGLTAWFSLRFAIRSTRSWSAQLSKE